MRLARIAAALVLAPFLVYSTYATWRHGYAEFFTGPLTNEVWLQEFFDLTISVTICSVWVWSDGRARGRTVWPYLALVPFLGSIPVLVYIVLRDDRPSGDAAQTPAGSP